MMIDDDNDGHLIFGDLRGLKLPDICLTGEENPKKTSPRKLVLTGDQTRAHCMTGAHATAWPTATTSATAILRSYIELWLQGLTTDNLHMLAIYTILQIALVNQTKQFYLISSTRVQHKGRVEG